MPGAGKWCLLLRSLVIQGSWNHRTLLGTGVAWALLPALRRRGEPGDIGSRIARAAQPFNAHPYLVPVALGALVRAEAENTDPNRVRRFREAIRSPLGSLGDGLVWVVWRPLCLLVAVLMVLLGVPALGAVMGFLLLYNALHFALRIWGMSIGLALGFGVGEGIRTLELPRWTERMAGVGVLVVGLVAGALIGRGLTFSWWGLGWFLGAAVFFVAGLLGGDSLRRWGPGLLLLLVLVGFVAGPDIASVLARGG